MEKLFSLTEPQKSIWLTEQFYQGYSVNNVSGTCFIYNRFSKSILKQAINNVVKNNSALRIRLTNTANGVMQYFSNFKSFQIPIIKLNNIQELSNFENEFASTTFKLFESSLFKVKIFNLKNGYGGMVFVCHHLICDGYSLGLLCRKIIKEYNRLDSDKSIINRLFKKQNEKEVKEEDRLDYKIFIDREQEYYKSEKYTQDKEYWENKFLNIPDVISLSKKGNNSISPVAKRLSFDIENNMQDKIVELCKNNKISTFIFFMSSLGIFINKMTYANNFVIGTPTLNRKDNIEKKIFGDFASVEPFVFNIENQDDFNTYSRSVAVNSIGMLKHSKYPINEILKTIRNTNSDYSGMYNVLFNYQLTQAQFEGNVKYNASWNFNNCNGDELDISVYDFNQEGKLSISYDYKVDKFDKNEIENIHERFMYIVSQILSSNGNIKIADINEVLREEYYDLLDIYNSTYQNYNKQKTIVELFETQVEKTPDDIAITFKEDKVSYKELNEKANIIGNYLREKIKVTNSDFVAILQNRSIDMIASIVGTVKSGATYVAIDPDYPEDRVEYMLTNCNSKITLINGYTQSISDRIEKISSIKVEEIYSKISKNEKKQVKQKSNLSIVSKPEDLLYVIYTSGSTGKPKGVCIQNYNVNNLIVGMRKIMDFTKVKNFACLATCCFDMFVFELWGSLLNGLNVVLADEDEQKIPPLLNKMCINNSVDVLQTTPSRLKLLFDNDEDECLKNIKHLFIGGEPVNNTIFERLLEYKNIRIHHMYGPTETTVWSTHKLIKNIDDITIGNPISNTKIYILNGEKVVPKNNVGEICISGDGVGLGYLDKPRITSQSFVQDIFNSSYTMYRTGDYGYINNNNELVYVGRSDAQVKINGYRVELTEIENIILNYPEISNSVVAKKSINNQDILCGYVISNKEINISDLKRYLQEKLPIYMVPKYIMQIDKFPYTQNGKIDRKSMPIPKIEDDKEIIIGARNDVDVKLIAEISKNLELTNISIDKNLFEIGLDSLLAINLSVYILNEFGIQISVNTIFNNPTIEKISDKIIIHPDFKENIVDYSSLNDILSIKKSKIERVKLQDYYDVSDNQRQIYLACKNASKDSLLYNVSGAIYFNQNINVEILRNSLLTLLNRHEAFKTSFDIKEDKIVQIINDDISFNIDIESIENTKEYINKDKSINVQKLLNEFIKPFDLKLAPLIRFKIVIIKDQVIVLIDSHHMICDGSSLNILVQELGRLYSGENLPEIKLTYKDYSAWKNISSRNNHKEEEFWLKQFKEEVPLLNLPTEKKRPLKRTFEGSLYSIKIENELFDDIRKIAKQYNTTPNILMLCAYYVLLYKYTGQKDFVVGTPISGRNIPELKYIIGVFINMLPIRLKIDSKLSFAQLLDNLKDICSNCYNNQNYQLENLANKIPNIREKSRNFLFDTLFIYQSNNYTNINFETLQGKVIRANTRTSKYDISLEVLPNETDYELTFEYSLELFDEDYIKSFAERYIYLLSQIVDNINVKISDVQMLSNKEKHRLLYDFNNSHKQIDLNNSIVKMFEKQVKQSSKHVAVVYNNMQITYEDLNQKANQLAKYLLDNKFDKSEYIAIALPRGVEILIAMIACLKAGKCYIPIDITYPQKRIEYMLTNSKTSIILTNSDFINQINEYLGNEEYDIIDISLKSNIYSDIVNNLDLKIDVNTPSYAIYTSGSTGKPKGITLTQKALTNLANYLNDYVDIFKDKRKNQSILSITTMSFDIFIFETLMSLQAGLKVILASDIEQNSLVLLDKLINRYNVKAIQATPSRMNIFVQNIDMMPNFSSINTFVLAGEPLPEKLRDELLSLNSKAKIYNGYGPSETTVYSTFTDVTKQEIINIGKPLYNTDMYVLDDDNNLLPVGIPGELYIAGFGVGLGYINNEKATKKRFINNPFENSLSDNMYKTGDMVKWQKDGTLYYIGRNDNQVKIRGLRIELDEIEKVIRKNKFVKECIIHVKNNEMQREYIVAYVILNKKVDLNELKLFASARLPKYMVPSYFVELENLPYLPNGKVDKKSLPEPNYSQDLDKVFIAPQNSIQIEIANIFEKLLKVNPISIDDDFFTLGGDSLLAINLQIELNKLGYNIAYADFFQNTTVRRIDEFIRTHNNLDELSKEGFYQYIQDDEARLLNNSIKDFTKMDNIINKPTGNVLITGVTGFLGSHVLEQFLINEKCLIYVLVRPQKGVSLRDKLKNKLHYYFGEKYDDQIDKRIIIISGDISKPYLGINTRELSLMFDNIGTIINCAALVSHYGNYATFEVMNVNSVKNLLELCKNNYKKFIQISTVSVSGVNLYKDTSNRVIDFAENDLYVNQPLDNVYIRSKFEAEKLVIEYINQGVDAYIFRIGNLTNRMSDLKFQPNVKENAFVLRLISFIKIGAIPKQLFKEHLEFTPVDVCSQAILLLIKSLNKKNRIFHLYNGNHVSVKDFIKDLAKHGIKIDIVEDEEFKDKIAIIETQDNASDILAGIIKDMDSSGNFQFHSNIRVSNDFTCRYLDKSGFSWPKIKDKYLNKFIEFLLNLM